MSVRTAQLGDFVRISGGGTPSRGRPEFFIGSIPWVTVKDLGGGFFLRGAQEHISQAGLDSSASRLIPPGNVLLATRMAVGRAVINTVEVAINQDLKALICHPRLHPSYLLFFLSHKAPELEAKATGATVKGITIDEIESLNIPVPNLSEQRRIAGLLEQADRLRRTRRYALELSDTFLPAAFLELFGDPSTNPKGWRSVCLGDVLLSAQDGPHVSPEYCERGIPFLSTRNVRAGELLWDDLKYISRDDAEKHWRKVKPARGDILYTKGGTTGLAKAVDFDHEVAVWVHIAVLKVRRELVVPVWLENMLNSAFCYRQSQELTFGIVNRDLGLKRMPNIRMYLPPIAIQEHFAEISKRFRHQRAIEREAPRQADHLFQSLLHRAFAPA